MNERFLEAVQASRLQRRDPAQPSSCAHLDNGPHPGGRTILDRAVVQHQAAMRQYCPPTGLHAGPNDRSGDADSREVGEPEHSISAHPRAECGGPRAGASDLAGYL